MTKRESLCRICGERLSYKGPDGQLYGENGCVDDEGLVCESCRAFAKLQKMREDSKKDGNR